MIYIASLFLLQAASAKEEISAKKRIFRITSLFLMQQNYKKIIIFTHHFIKYE
jgi:hypothetical protein